MDFFGGEMNYTRDPYIEYIERLHIELGYIKSSKVSTLEMLFEADEIERLANEAERKQLNVINSDTNDVIEMSAERQYVMDVMKDDPEAMIKLLRKRNNV